MTRSLLLFSLVALGVTHPARAETSPDPMAAYPDAALPSGKLETCKVIRRNVDAGGGHTFLMLESAAGFFMALPEATDWKLQCDGKHLLWAFSRSSRMQVTVFPDELAPGEAFDARAYLSRGAARLKATVTENGLIASEPTLFSVSPQEGLELWGVELGIDAPAGKEIPLFPQDTFLTARKAGRYVLRAHFTVYPRTAAERASLRSIARTLTGLLVVPEDAPAPQGDLRVDKKGPAPRFPGVSASRFSSEMVAVVRKGLPCADAAIGWYCSALDRFAKAKPLAANTSGVWAGSMLLVFPAGDGPPRSAENIHHLHLKDGMGSFNKVEPSSESETREIRALLDRIHQGKAPDPASDIMKYLSTFTPMIRRPVSVQAASLSFEIPVDARVFVRENETEILAAAIWGDGVAAQIAVFPKK